MNRIFKYAVTISLSLAPQETFLYTQQTTGQKDTLLLQSDFENVSSFKPWTKEICRPDAITLSKQFARKGKSSARFELAKTDAIEYDGYVRAEIKQNFHSDETGENWYGFSNFFPVGYAADPLAEVVAQWHDIPDWQLGENWRSPPISLEIKNDRYAVKVMWASAMVNSNRTKDGEKYYDLGPVGKNKWNDWVFHIKFSYKQNGVLEVWRNKTKVLTRLGPNSYNDERFPYFKLGIYKWGWADGGADSPESKRILYVDEVRVGNHNASLVEVSPPK